MVPYVGDFSEDATVRHVFNTFSSDDPAASVTITNLADADIKVHKDGSATQIVTDGATVAIDFDSTTGGHMVTIDTSVHADYSTGSDYHVRMEGTTVDGATINAFIFSFSIENRHSAGALRPTTAGRTLDVTATGAAGIDWGNVENPGTTVDLSATDINLVDTTTTNTDMRGTDNAALASVLGELNDAAAAGDPTNADTVVQYLKQLINTLEGTAGIPTFPAEAAPANNVSVVEVLRAIHADVTGLNGDAMRGTDSAYTGTPPTAAAIRAEIDSNSTQLAAIVSDTNELQTDDVPGLIAALENISAADVNAQVLDVLNTDTFAEPVQGAPGATISLAAKIGYLYKAWRNRSTQTADTYSLYNDDATTVDHKATVSDDGTTADKGEVATGP